VSFLRAVRQRTRGPRRREGRERGPVLSPWSSLYTQKKQIQQTDGVLRSYKTQHACCTAAFGARGCAFSGGAASLRCWAPDAASKKCTLRRVGQGSCDTGLRGGYQDQAVCQAEEFPGGKPRLAGVSWVQRQDVVLDEGADIPSPGGTTPYTRVCGGNGMFMFTCARTPGCVGYSLDAKELTKGCAVLKKAGGKAVARRGWLTFTKQGGDA